MRRERGPGYHPETPPTALHPKDSAPAKGQKSAPSVAVTPGKTATIDGLRRRSLAAQRMPVLDCGWHSDPLACYWFGCGWRSDRDDVDAGGWCPSRSLDWQEREARGRALAGTGRLP